MELKENSLKDSARSEREQENEKLCKICYEADSIDNHIITPCECSGSMKYVHDQCLKTWILSQNKCPKSFTCDICKYKIKMNIKEKRVFTTKHIKSEFFKLVVLIFIILISTSVFVFINYTMFSDSGKSISSSGKIYLSVLLVICVVVLVSLIIVLVKVIRSKCFEITIDQWVILSNYKQIEQVDNTYLTDYFEKRIGKKSNKIQKYVIRPEESVLMVRNSQIQSLDSEEGQGQAEGNPSANPELSRTPNEVESLPAS